MLMNGLTQKCKSTGRETFFNKYIRWIAVSFTEEFYYFDVVKHWKRPCTYGISSILKDLQES